MRGKGEGRAARNKSLLSWLRPQRRAPMGNRSALCFGCWRILHSQRKVFRTSPPPPCNCATEARPDCLLPLRKASPLTAINSRRPPATVQVKRGLDLKEPGSQDADPLFSGFKLKPHEARSAAGGLSAGRAQGRRDGGGGDQPGAGWERCSKRSQRAGAALQLQARRTDPLDLYCNLLHVPPACLPSLKTQCRLATPVSEQRRAQRAEQPGREGACWTRDGAARGLPPPPF